jgi:heme A synthase
MELIEMIKSSKYNRAFRLHALLALIALVLEFILGMYTAFFVKFPDTLTDGNAWAWSMSHSAIIMAHILLGTLMVLIALSAVGFAVAAKSKSAIITAVVGVVMILVAYLSGSIFLGNIEVDGYSFSMSLGFLGAMVAYGLGYYLTRPSLITTN